MCLMDYVCAKMISSWTPQYLIRNQSNFKGFRLRPKLKPCFFISKYLNLISDFARMTSEDQKAEYVSQAKLSDQAELYDDMTEFMRHQIRNR